VANEEMNILVGYTKEIDEIGALDQQDDKLPIL
jgi:hypothetical protein